MPTMLPASLPLPALTMLRSTVLARAGAVPAVLALTAAEPTELANCEDTGRGVASHADGNPGNVCSGVADHDDDSCGEVNYDWRRHR